MGLFDIFKISQMNKHDVKDLKSRKQPNLLNGVKSIGNAFGHAAEDTFNFGKKTVSSGVKIAGNVGSSVLNFADKQTDKIAGIFSSPTILILGAGIILIMLMKK